MTDGLNVELWTLPNSGNFVRIADVTKWIVAAELDVRFSDLSGGSITFGDGIPYTLIEVDPDDHTNDVGRTLMFFRDGVWLAAFVIVEEDDLASSELPVSTYVVEGVLDYFADRARIKAFDYPAYPIREGDWLYGAPSILPPAGTQISNDRTEIFTDATSGTFTLTDGTDTTGAINFNESAADLRTELITSITAITDCSVSGNGSVDFPWAIELLDPSGTPISIAVAVNSTNGNISVNAIRQGGDYSPLPYHGTVDATTGLRVGTYQEFSMVEAGVGGAPAAPAGSTSTYLLKLDPDSPRAAGDYAGFQIEPGIASGSRYRASVKAISPVSPQRVRFVLRDLEENTLAWIETTVSSSWVTLTAVDVDGGAFIEFPEGIDIVVYRCGVISEVNADPVYFDVNEAILAPGDVAKPYGEITSELRAPMVTRNVLDWMLEGWTATLDASGAAWDSDLAVGVRKGQSFLQWLEWGRDTGGYEWNLRYTGGTVTPFTLDLFNPGNAGTDLTGTGVSISAVDGLVEQGSRIKRAPDATDVTAEGADGAWGEASNTNLRTGWGVLESYFANRQGRDGLASIAARVVADSARESAGRKITTRNPKTTPLDTVKLGDTVTVVPLGEPPKSQRLVGVTISIDSQPAPEYDYHFDSLVFEPEAAQADAVRSLIRRFEALDTLGGNCCNGGGFNGLALVGQSVVGELSADAATRSDIATTIDETADTTLSAQLPSYSVGDLVIVMAATDAIAANFNTTPTGWTEAVNNDYPPETPPCVVYWKIMDGSEGSTLSITMDAGPQHAIAIAIAHSGFDFTALAPDFSSLVRISNAPLVNFSHGDQIPYDTYVCIFDANAQAVSVADPDGYTEVVDLNAGLQDGRIWLWEKRIAAGASSTDPAFITTQPFNDSHLIVTFAVAGEDPSTVAAASDHVHQDQDIDSEAATSGYVLTADGAGGADWQPADDPDAIHDNVAAEISAITEKTLPVAADLLLIEDSAASNAKKRLQIGNLPARQLFVATADKVVANTVTETSLFGTGVGSLTLPANYLVAGRTVEVEIRGRLAATGNPNRTIRLKLGGTTITSLGPTAIAAVSGTVEFRISLLLTCRTAGASGVVVAGGVWSHSDGTFRSLPSGTNVNVDTTGTLALDVTFEWGTASASNTITAREAVVR